MKEAGCSKKSDAGMIGEFRIIMGCVEGLTLPDGGRSDPAWKVAVRFKYGAEDYGTYVLFGEERPKDEEIGEAVKELVLSCLDSLRVLRGEAE